MWTRACEMIDHAERLHRQFIRPVAAPVYDLSWESPVDITATNSDILITVALPGVDRDAVAITVDDDGISVVSLRSQMIPPGSVRNLERHIGALFRHAATRIAEGNGTSVTFTVADLHWDRRLWARDGHAHQRARHCHRAHLDSCRGRYPVRGGNQHSRCLWR
jgi:hypothetical protein